jgi:small subunit ribosomal protein S8
MDTTANLLNRIMNAKKAGKTSCLVRPISKFALKVLEIMKKEGYLNYKVEEDKFPAVNVTFPNLNFGKVIKPRFYVKKEGYEKYVRRFLPSRHLGIIIVSTNKGLMTHKEAIEKNLGGGLIAFCY